MLEFSAPQHATTVAPWRRDVAWRLTQTSRDLWPQVFDPLGPDRSYRRVCDQIDLGISYRIKGQDDLLRLVAIAVAIGWDWPADRSFAWIGALLADQEAGDPTTRLRIVMRLLRARS